MTGSLTLVIDRRTAAVRLDGGALRVDLPDGGFRRAPLALLEQVVVHGPVPVSSDVWRALAGRGIGAVLLPGRSCGKAAFVGAGLSAFAHWRVRQYAAFFSPQRHLEMARRVLILKLSAHAKRAASPPMAARGAEEVLHRAIGAAAAAQSPNALRGVEGAAAAHWFVILAECVPPPWRFSARTRRPPRDPVNALLSLGYTLALGTVRSEVLVQGLDPALGFLHVPAPARESFVLDALEPLRAGVDGFVMDVLAQFEPADFTTTRAEGCRLRKTARGRFYTAWAQSCQNGFGGLFGDTLPTDEPQSYDEEEPAGASLAAACRASVGALRRALPAAAPPETPQCSA